MQLLASIITPEALLFAGLFWFIFGVVNKAKNLLSVLFYNIIPILSSLLVVSYALLEMNIIKF